MIQQSESRELDNFNPTQNAPFSLGKKVAIRAWWLVENTLFRWSPSVFRKWRVYLLRLFGAKISLTASVSRFARIDCPWNLAMEDFASVGDDAWIYALDRISIGKYACVGQRVMLLTGSHDPCDRTFSLVTAPISIESGAWIAVGAIVLPGITVEKLAVVGAGSVVTRSLPSKMICAGNPCRPIKQREFS